MEPRLIVLSTPCGADIFMRRVLEAIERAKLAQPVVVLDETALPGEVSVRRFSVVDLPTYRAPRKYLNEDPHTPPDVEPAKREAKASRKANRPAWRK